MERLDKLTEVLMQGNALSMAHLEMKVSEADKQAKAQAPGRTFPSADDQIKALLAKQREKLREASDG
jgi:hypothetical protein